MKKYEKVLAFTLAEVLVTLSILGVVAAISIPNMVQQYQKRLTVTKIQKAYSELNQMATNIAVNTGCFGRDLACTNLLNISDTKDLATTFTELSQLKNTTLKRNTKWVSQYGDHSKGYSALDYIIKSNQYQLVITKADTGIVDNCSSTAPIYNNFLKIYIITDLNPKEYILGKNTFLVILNRDFQVITPSFTAFSKFCPSETDSDSHLTSVCTSKGISCLAKIVKDGWKINY